MATMPKCPTVLVMDDDDQVRQMARRILEHAWYQVLTAIDGREGIQISESRNGEVSSAPFRVPRTETYQGSSRMSLCVRYGLSPRTVISALERPGGFR